MGRLEIDIIIVEKMCWVKPRFFFFLCRNKEVAEGDLNCEEGEEKNQSHSCKLLGSNLRKRDREGGEGRKRKTD